MLFKDLKPGDRFFFDEGGDLVKDDYGVLFYTKLEKPVICQESLEQMRKGVSKKEELSRLLDLVCGN